MTMSEEKSGENLVVHLLSSVSDLMTEILVSVSDCDADGKETIVDEGQSLIGCFEEFERGITDKSTSSIKALLKRCMEFCKDLFEFDEKSLGGETKSILKYLRRKLNELAHAMVKFSPDESDVKRDNVEAEKNPKAAKMIFHKITPLKVNDSYECGLCSVKPFTNFTSYKRHMSSNHKLKPTDGEPTCHCYLPDLKDANKKCMVEKPRDQMYRHLGKHGFSRPSKQHFLRGFLSLDHGKTFSPCFLLENEKDPDESQSSDEELKDLDQEMDALEKDYERTRDFSPPYVSNLDTADVTAGTASGPSSNLVKDHNKRPENSKEDDSHDDDGPSGAVDDLELNDANLEVSSLENDDPEQEKEEWVSSAHESGLLKLKFTKVSSLVDKRGEDDNQGALDDQEEENSELEIDSDVEDDDTEVFTKLRMRNKSLRYEKRSLPDDAPVPLHERPENAEFIEQFSAYMRSDENIATANKNKCTYTNTNAVLFRADDSYLAYEVSRDPSFNLGRLLSFDDHEQFLFLKSPTDWINSIGGYDGKDNAIRRKEMLKCSARMRRFLMKVVDDEDTGGSNERIERFSLIRKKMKQIDKTLQKSKILTNLQKIIDNDKALKNQAEAVLTPDKNVLESNSVEVWFKSQECEQLEGKNNNVWKEGVESGTVKAKDFTDFCKFVVFNLWLTDKSRRSAYKLLNQDFARKKAIYWPDGHNKDGQFDGLPEGVNIYEKIDGRDPDGYVLTITGGGVGLKGQDGVTLYFTQRTYQWMEKYRDLKNILFKDKNPKADDFFFVTSTGNPPAPLNNYRGSLLDKFSKATGQKHVTSNSLRRAAEPIIQNSPELLKHSKDINNHSSAVGDKFYNKRKSDMRASLLHRLSVKESSTSKVAHDDVSEELKAKRAKLDHAENEMAIEEAKKVLRKKTSRKVELGRNCKVLPVDREYIQKLFIQDDFRKALGLSLEEKFPADKLWRKRFYRFIDGEIEDGVVRERLLEIEKKTFGVMLDGVLKETNSDKWDGSLKQNRCGDKLVAKALRNSLKYYESNKQSYQETFFKF